ncbi:Uncharacterised protein [Bacillus tequilensis]|nr:Uncharacterised protein [Bacillus tequilensis]
MPCFLGTNTPFASLGLACLTVTIPPYVVITVITFILCCSLLDSNSMKSPCVEWEKGCVGGLGHAKKPVRPRMQVLQAFWLLFRFDGIQPFLQLCFIS